MTFILERPIKSHKVPLWNPGNGGKAGLNYNGIGPTWGGNELTTQTLNITEIRVSVHTFSALFLIPFCRFKD